MAELPHEKDARENNLEILSEVERTAGTVFPLPSPKRLNIMIGGKTLALELEGEGLLEHFRDFYGPFITDAPPDALVEITRHDVLKKERFPTTAVGGDGQRTWLARWDFCALLDSKARTLKGMLRTDAPEFSPDALLRIAFSSFFLNEGFMLVHGICASDGKGSAALFVGPSQSGKSTLAKGIRAEAEILADDVVCITEAPDGKFTAHSTPFWSFKEKEFNTDDYKQHSAQLRACSTLVKDPEPSLRRLNLLDGPESILPNIVYFGSDEGGRRTIFDIAMRMSMGVPFYELHFPREAKVWGLVKDTFFSSDTEAKNAKNN